jgi:hypothetical protein
MKKFIFSIAFFFVFVGIGGIAAGEISLLKIPDDLVQAMIFVESTNNDSKIGDPKLKNKAYGPLQVRQLACDDVNKAFGTHYRAKDCLGNRSLSIEILTKYSSMWKKENIISYEQIARRWNGGGPHGDEKTSTIEYWQKVLKALKERRPS